MIGKVMIDNDVVVDLNWCVISDNSKRRKNKEKEWVFWKWLIMKE